MAGSRAELVRIDSTGTAHPIGPIASQRMRQRQGAFRLMPAPEHLVVMRFVGEDGKRDEEDGPVLRLSGEITKAGALCDIVALIGHASWQGELVVQDGDTSRSVYFDAGLVINGSSNAEGERLGEVLYRYGALTEEQVDKAAEAVTSEMRFGEAAVSLGFITREKLFSLIGKQTEEIVYALLRVGDGMFYFLENYDPSRIVSRLNLPLHNLLMEGVRRMDETKYFRERIPSDQHVPTKSGERPPGDEHLVPFYDAVDGQRTVADICRVVGQGEFEVTQALFQLVQGGQITVQAPRPTGPAAIVARFNEAMDQLMDKADELGKGGEVREQLSSFATGAGVYDALFLGAGPTEKGTLDADRVVDNIGMLVGPDQAEAMLGQWLYEYASFALFLAEPFIRQQDGGLVKAVGELIAPLSRQKQQPAAAAPASNRAP